MEFRTYALISTVLAAVVAGISAIQNPTFYSASAQITHSLFMALTFANFAVMIAAIAGKVVTFAFLGRLREVEIERLLQHIGLLVLDTAVTMSSLSQVRVTSSMLSAGYVVVFLLALHWLAKERVIMLFHAVMEPSTMMQIRYVGFLVFLSYLDVKLAQYTWQQFIVKNYNMMFYIMDMVQMFNLILESAGTFAINRYESYYLNKYDEEHWEQKSLCKFLLQATNQLFRLVSLIAVCFFLGKLVTPIVGLIVIQAISLSMTVTKFVRARGTQNALDRLVIDASAQDVEHDNTCVVCRDEMDVNCPQPGLVPKRLSCGHVLHKSCLKMWLGRSQHCPTCRQPVKAAERPANHFANRNLDTAAAAETPAPRPTENRPVENGSIKFSVRREDGIRQVNIGDRWLTFTVTE